MNTILAGVLVLGCMATCTAQDTLKKSERSLSFNFGVGFPTGAFASTNETSDESGYALLGTSLEAVYTSRKPDKKYGVLGRVRFNSFGYDIETMISNARPSGAGLWFGDGENWVMTSFQLGGFRHIPLSGNTYLQAQLAMGMVFLAPKDRYVRGIGATSGYKVRSDYNNEATSGFSWTLGLALHSRLSEKMEFFLGTDFFSASPSVDYTLVYTEADVIVGTTKGTFDQPINALTLFIGLAVRL